MKMTQEEAEAVWEKTRKFRNEIGEIVCKQFQVDPRTNTAIVTVSALANVAGKVTSMFDAKTRDRLRDLFAKSFEAGISDIDKVPIHEDE